VKVFQNNMDNQEPQQQIDPINESIMDKKKNEAQKSKSNATTSLTTEMLVELNDVQPSQSSKSPNSEKHDSGDIPYCESSSTTNSKSILDLDLKKKEITEAELFIENDKKTTTPSISPKKENPPHKPTKAPTSFFQDAYRAEDVMGLSDEKIQERHAKTKVKKHMPNYLEELEKSKCLTTKWENRAALKKKPENHIVNLHELRQLASQGISNQGSDRAVAWRVLLGYLPPETSKWEEVLHRDQMLYRTLISELFVQPSHKENAYESTTEGKQLRGKGIENDGKSVLDLKSNKKKQS